VEKIRTIKSSDQRLTDYLFIRLRPSERAALELEAEAQKVSLSEVARLRLFPQQPQRAEAAT